MTLTHGCRRGGRAYSVVRTAKIRPLGRVVECLPGLSMLHGLLSRRGELSVLLKGSIQSFAPAGCQSDLGTTGAFLIQLHDALLRKLL